MRRTMPMVALALTLLVTAACNGSHSTNASATQNTAQGVTLTEVIKYTPTIPTDEEREGRCWTSSLAVAREDAWRCMVGNQIFDPCFAVGSDQAIVCGTDPVTNKSGFRLKLTEPLPAPDLPPQVKENYKGWLIQLTDGTMCGYATGATGGVNGERANYLCSDKSVILGDLKPSQVWTAKKAILESGPNGFSIKESQIVTIHTVWQ